MVNDILLYVSSILILISFLIYVLEMFINKRKKITNSNSFNIIKDMISEYDSINIVESRSYFTVYNIKRKVIKLDTKTYYGNDLSSIIVALISASISIVDNNKNKYIDLFRNIISNLKLLYIFPFLAILINFLTYSVSDAKVSIIFFSLFSFISYILMEVKEESIVWINDNIKKVKDISKNNAIKIEKILNKIILFDKVIFFGEFIMIVRCVLILLEIN